MRLAIILLLILGAICGSALAVRITNGPRSGFNARAPISGVAVSNTGDRYKRPDGTSNVFRPDGTSTYRRP